VPLCSRESETLMSMSISTPLLVTLRDRLLGDQMRPDSSSTKQARFSPFVTPRDGMTPTRPVPLAKDAAARPTRGTLPVATLFHEPWWLETATDGTFQEARVYADGAVIGRLPYMISKKFGRQTALVMPTMTHVLGPSLTTDLAGSRLTRSLKTVSICGDLIAQLPPASHIWFECHGQTPETVAFESAGFSSGVRFTIEISPEPVEALWRQMRDKTRNVIRRAQETLTVEEVVDPNHFLNFYEINLQKRGLRNNYDRRLCGNLMAEAIRRGVGRLLVATDASGVLQSGIFTAWDGRSEYYLMSTRSPESGNGATSLLIWHAIQRAASAGLTFDMDGVHGKKNFTLLAGFGGVLKPRYFVSRTSAMFQVAQYIKSGLVGRAS
jgi:hypothetical protein